MLSDHELTVKVRDDLFPRVRQIQEECSELFNKQFFPPHEPWSPGDPIPPALTVAGLQPPEIATSRNQPATRGPS